MNSIDQTRLLQMRSTIIGQNSALQRAVGNLDTQVTQPLEFGDTLAQALSAVNKQQAEASTLSAQYERGETHDIASVMIERQKASLGFEATLQVRNKILSAYRDVMNMPV